MVKEPKSSWFFLTVCQWWKKTEHFTFTGTVARCHNFVVKSPRLHFSFAVKCSTIWAPGALSGHMLLSHAAFTFWTCTEVRGGKAFLTRREESLRGNGHYLPPGGGEEEIGESFWLCRITIFLDSLPRIWIGRQQFPLFVLPPLHFP